MENLNTVTTATIKNLPAQAYESLFQQSTDQTIFLKPRVFLDNSGSYIIHKISDNLITRIHVNFYKKILERANSEHSVGF